MTHRRPVVALHISMQLFRDVLAKALHPHADVVIAPESDTEYAEWAERNREIDVAIVSGVTRVIDLDRSVVVDVPPANGAAPVGRVRGDGEMVSSLDQLLALVAARRSS